MRNGYTAVALVAALLSTQAAAEGGSPWAVMPCWGGGYVQGATFCPSDPNRMYLYVDVGGPYRSDDAGASWRPLHADMPVEMRERGFDQVRSLSVDPRDADSLVILGGADGDTPVVFACRDGLFASNDGGDTLRPIDSGLRVTSGRSRFIYDRRSWFGRVPPLRVWQCNR